ncbi:MAG: MurR/RpiR family transcriptional regulator [Proteobacteria bacterium]|nr:MurR/RpiR family transcriptional regulator [Pseudomonadota bacterium]
MMNPIFHERVQRGHSKLTRSQVALAQYILQHGEEVPFLSSAELGKRIHVSDATVTRFCIALGYAGYADLQKDLQKWLQMRLAPSERMEKTPRKKGEDLYLEVFNRDIQNLKETSAELRPEQFREVIGILNRARKVFIVGLRSSFGLAVLAHSHFRSIRNGVTLVESNWGMMPDLLVDIETPDAMLAIGFPRYTRATLEVARYAKGRGCQVITITDSILSPLARISDFVIQAKISGLGFINFYTSAVAIINCLSAGLSMANPTRSIQTLKTIEGELKKWEIWAAQKL